MIASRTAALTGAAACGNDSVVRDILRPSREGQVRERTDGVGVDSRKPTSGRTALHFACAEIKYLLSRPNHDLHAIDATPGRRCGGVDSSPLCTRHTR